MKNKLTFKRTKGLIIRGMKTGLVIWLTVFFQSIVLAQVAFVDTSFQSMIDLAYQEKKYAMVDAFTEWCGWCKRMDQITFADTAVGLYFSKNLVAAKFDMEEGAGIDLAMKYRVSDYPHFLFFDQEGHLIGRISGYMEPVEFIDAVEKVLNPAHFLPPLENPMNFDLGFPEFHRKSYLKRSERSNPSSEEIQAWLQTRSGLLDETTWGVVSRYVGGGVYAGEVIRYRHELIARYGPDEIYDKLASFVFSDVKSAIKEQNESKLFAALDMGNEILDDRAPIYALRYSMYFYQMTGRWSEYANIGTGIWQKKDTTNFESLPYMAQTMLNQSAPKEAMMQSYQWMKSLSERSDADFDTLYLTAQLAMNLENQTDFDALYLRASEVATTEELAKLRTLDKP